MARKTRWRVKKTGWGVKKKKQGALNTMDGGYSTNELRVAHSSVGQPLMFPDGKINIMNIRKVFQLCTDVKIRPEGI